MQIVRDQMTRTIKLRPQQDELEKLGAARDFTDTFLRKTGELGGFGGNWYFDAIWVNGRGDIVVSYSA